MIWILLIGLLCLGLAGLMSYLLWDDYHPFPVIFGIRFNGYFLGYIWIRLVVIGSVLTVGGLFGWLYR